MEDKHYKLREDLSIEFRSRTLYRIEALKDLPQHNVKKGDIGGYVESYDNLLWEAWIGGFAKVFGDARVFGSAKVSGNSRVFGDAKVYGCSQIVGDAQVCGYALVYGNALVDDDSRVYGNAQVYDNAFVFGNARVHGSAQVCGSACVLFGNIKKRGDVKNIIGEKYNITILPNHIQIGCQWHTKEAWFNFEDREILKMDGKEGLKWWKKWKPLLQGMSE